MKKIFQLILIIAGIGIFFQSCMSDPNSPGLEYMPDMYRSPSVEAYVDYGMDPYHFGDSLAELQRNTQSARLPVEGTIEYGQVFMPYYLKATPDDYERAGTEIRSPMAMTKSHIEEGKVIYERMCSHCHGVKGDGMGKLATNEAILGIPNFGVGLKDLPEGNMFHTITHGKGIMGSHASQVNPKERWQIIQYIHILQDGGKMPEFNEAGYPIGYEKHWSSLAGYTGTGAYYPPSYNGGGEEGSMGDDMMGDANYDFNAMFGDKMDKMKIIDGSSVGRPGYVMIDGEWYTIAETQEPGFWDKFKGWIKRTVDKVKDKIDEKREDKDSEEGEQ